MTDRSSDAPPPTGIPRMGSPRTATEPREIVLRPSALSLPPGPWDVPAVLRALSDRRGLIALDSVGGSPRRWSIVGLDPFVDFAAPGAAPTTLAELEALLGTVQVDLPEGLDVGPFAGGFLGALGYELGVAGDPLPLPEAAWPQPPIVGGLYGDWLLFEHDGEGEVRSVTAFACDGIPGGAGSSAVPAADRLQALAAMFAAAPAAVDPLADSRPLQASREAQRTVTQGEHCARIERTRAEIARGEIYQANISHRMVADADPDALELYLRLRDANPSPYMGFLRFPFADGAEGALMSSSPELLVEVGAGRSGSRVARTRPIKGTIGRGATFLQDVAQRGALVTSDKDLAELAMIVDLERNDLGRIATPGGVEVLGFPTIETYAAVHHLVADVRATVRDDVSSMGVVASLFPGGSITGAPKLRSMEVIAAEEGEGRGFFTGSLGFIDARGHIALNILIRTFVHRRQPGADEAQVSFHVGGGITWRSDALAEDHETLLKAEGLLRALRSGPVPGA